MDKLNKALFAFASYNAGAGRIRQLRAEAAKRGLDPNVWFGNVAQIASERIGRETVTYVSNIYRYYVAYRLVLAEKGQRDATKQTFQSASESAGVVEYTGVVSFCGFPIDRTSARPDTAG